MPAIEPAFSRARRRVVLAAAALPWCSAASAAASHTPRQEWPPRRTLPRLELADLAGAPWQAASLRGHPVLLNFWATWCEPCRAEMPALQQLVSDHQAEGLQVVAVNFKETEGAVRRFLQQTALTLPVLLDRDGTAAKSLGVHIFPSTIAIDRRGQPRFVVTGEFDWTSAQAARWIAEL